MVIVDKNEKSENFGKIIGAGTVFVEKKFIHECGKAAHVEDIVVVKGYRGKNLGLKLIEILNGLAKMNGCYKVILDCEPHNVKFYEKNGYSLKGVEMAHYFNLDKQRARL